MLSYIKANYLLYHIFRLFSQIYAEITNVMLSFLSNFLYRPTLISLPRKFTPVTQFSLVIVYPMDNNFFVGSYFLPFFFF